MDTVKTCPACHKDNQPDAAVCAFCGTPMLGLLPSRTTEPVPDIPLKIKPPDHIVQLTKLYADMVVLVVLGQEQPILLKGGGKTVLGRYSPGEVSPSVDLTPHNANLLGVSRQHAAISRSDNAVMLEDLGSTNGTWLNEVKLVPNKPSTLQSGDLVRLGQLGLYVYFDTHRADTQLETEFILQKDGTAETHLTIQDLSAHLIPYLTALIGIQSLYDEMANRKTSDMNITALNFDVETGQLKFRLNNAADIHRLLRSKIAPWISKYLKQISLIVEIKPVPATPNAATSAPPQPDVDGQNNLADGLRQEFEKTKSQLADDLVNGLTPELTDAQKKELAEKLLPYLHSLAVNAFHVVAAD